MIRKYEDRYIFNLDINVRVRRIRKDGIRSREIATNITYYSSSD